MPRVVVLQAKQKFGGLRALIRTAQRVLDDHSNEIVFNNCPRCGALAKAPKARQCRFCRHDWHSSDAAHKYFCPATFRDGTLTFTLPEGLAPRYDKSKEEA